MIDLVGIAAELSASVEPSKQAQDATVYIIASTVLATVLVILFLVAGTILAAIICLKGKYFADILDFIIKTCACRKESPAINQVKNCNCFFLINHSTIYFIPH